MHVKTLFIIVVAVTLSAVAQLLLKLGVAKGVGQTVSFGLMDTALKYITSGYVWGGFVLYGISMGLWLWVLAKVDLSVAYPFVGLSFLLTMFFGAYLLNENISFERVVGTMLIVSGCVLIARSA